MTSVAFYANFCSESRLVDTLNIDMNERDSDKNVEAVEQKVEPVGKFISL